VRNPGYAAPDGTVKVQVLFRDETAWLPQKSLAELFGVKGCEHDAHATRCR